MIWATILHARRVTYMYMYNIGPENIDIRYRLMNVMKERKSIPLFKNIHTVIYMYMHLSTNIHI